MNCKIWNLMLKNQLLGFVSVAASLLQCRLAPAWVSAALGVAFFRAKKRTGQFERLIQELSLLTDFISILSFHCGFKHPSIYSFSVLLFGLRGADACTPWTDHKSVTGLGSGSLEYFACLIICDWLNKHLSILICSQIDSPQPFSSQKSTLYKVLHLTIN